MEAVGPRALALLALLVGAPAAAQSPAPADPSRTLVALLDSAVAAGFSGSVLVADGAGRIVLERHAGFADRASGRPIDATTRWRWASVSKQVTAVLVMQEVAAGRLELDAPAERWLPALRTPGRAPITVRQLLHHSSGLRSPDADVPDDVVPPFYLDATNAQRAVGAVPAVCASRGASEPGTAFAYNNCDYIVLTALLEAVTATPFATLLAQRLAPAGIPSVTMANADERTGPMGPAGGVVGYGADGGPERSLLLAAYAGAGAMQGTARALLAFDRALLGGALLPETQRAESWRGRPEFGYAALGVWSFASEIAGCAAPLAIVERRGDIGGVQVRNLLLPGTGHSIIVFTNAPWSFGEIWMGSGFTYALIRAVACTA